MPILRVNNQVAPVYRRPYLSVNRLQHALRTTDVEAAAHISKVVLHINDHKRS